MTKLQEHLYRYISEDCFPALNMSEEFVQARQMRNTLEKQLSALLTEEQRTLFGLYMDAENFLDSLLLRHVFLETLNIIPDILNLPVQPAKAERAGRADR